MSTSTFPRIPSATYRLQFHAGFTFKDAQGILDYLEALGVSDVYASPYFQSSPTSTHGYDVADHNRINPAIGDDSDFRAYVADLRARGMGQVLDFVPNHMGIGASLNQWWLEVLEDGSESPYAKYFDIDWSSRKEGLAGRVLLPILGDRYGKVLEDGEFSLIFEDGAFYLDYFETRLPINPKTYDIILRVALTSLEGDSVEKLREAMVRFNAGGAEGKFGAKNYLADLVKENPSLAQAIEETLRHLEGTKGDAESYNALHDLLENQAYRLSYWRVAAEEINYRRFFDINTLAAIRIEIPEVFDAAHHLVFELLARGEVTGLRIDHIDGLWDPRQYLVRVQQRFAEIVGLSNQEDGLYLLVEKILDLTREQLPLDWPTHGTTGYEFANQVVQVLADASSEKKITAIYQRFTRNLQSFADLVYEKKKLTMQLALSSEVTALGRALDELSEMHRHYRDLTGNTLTFAVREVIACFPVYRTYVNEEGVLSPEDEKVVIRAILAARRRNPAIEKSVFDFIRNVLMMRLPETLSAEQRAAHIRFVMKFQQCSGPVMAKGLEDTSFYIYNRLAALNEVGGNPGQFGITVDEFHRLNTDRGTSHPHCLLATSTHDTKRSEDTRMRMVSLSEMPDQWKKALQLWSKLNKKHKGSIDGEIAPSFNEEYLIYQTLLGTWPFLPFSETDRELYTGRIKQYMLKALKEAKINSSWTEPNEPWEKAVEDFISRILDPKVSSSFLSSLEDFAPRVAEAGAMNSLAEVVLKCTSPGVPDVYQGTELWDLSLVDPDNRRPVDYDQRKSLLSSIDDCSISELLGDWKSGRIKLALLQRLLTFRRDNAEFFRKSSYEAIPVKGAFANNVLAYQRVFEGNHLIVVIPRLTHVLGFAPVGERWQDTELMLESAPDQSPWLSVLAKAEVALSDLRLSSIFSEFPFAVLYLAK